MSNNKDSLFKVPESEYGESYKDDYLTIYQDYVASADKISERRHTANTFSLSVNTALLAATGYMTGSDANQAASELIASEPSLLWLVALAGAVFSFTWMRLIASYRSLNTAKFKVIHQLEQRLPFAAYDEEWVQLEGGRNSDVHVPFSKVESRVPLVFMLMHLVVFMANFVPWIRSFL